ncbi:MAG: Hsp20 family protein [Saprospiraceae bacterium]|nr:Hsp20 family protein [Saprospiraceae bacterium]
MAVERVDSGPFERFESRFKKVINPHHFLGRSAFDIPWQDSFPPANVKRDKDAYHIDLMVPGFERDELEITVEHGTLIVRGTTKDKVPSVPNQFIEEEFSIESFERRFRIANLHADDHIEAFLDNGILRIIFYSHRDPVYSQYKRIQVIDTD